MEYKFITVEMLIDDFTYRSAEEIYKNWYRDWEKEEKENLDEYIDKIPGDQDITIRIKDRKGGELDFTTWPENLKDLTLANNVFKTLKESAKYD